MPLTITRRGRVYNHLMTTRAELMLIWLIPLLVTEASLGEESRSIPVSLEENRFYAHLSFQGVDAKLLLDTGGTTGIYQEFAYYWKTDTSKLGEGDDKNFIRFKSPSSPFKDFLPDTIPS